MKNLRLLFQNDPEILEALDKKERIKASALFKSFGKKIEEIQLIPGEKGEKGDSPTDEELTSLIKPLIPVPKDGKTPTKEELLALIKPLIPKVKDGETPSDSRLIALITPLIPPPVKGRDGRDGANPSVDEIVEAIRKDKRLDISDIRNWNQPGRGRLDQRWHGAGTSGSSNTFVDNEVVSGSGTSWTLADTPTTGSVHLYAVGQRLTPTVDYTISGISITTVLEWNAGDILADYRTS